MEASAILGSGGQFFLSWLLVWALGVVCGLVCGGGLPRPKWLQRKLRPTAWNIFLASPPGLWFRRVTLAFHATLIVRQLWRYYHTPGTFHAVLKALLTWQPIEWPRHHDGKVLVDPDMLAQEEQAPQDGLPNWYVTLEDLAFFRSKVEVEEPGATKWDHMMDISYENTTYAAWRRAVAGGTEYKSITITPNATAEEFMDFYLDDPTRPKWDGMITDYSIVEQGVPEQRCLVVRWKRTFPFSFINSREYVIARRVFRVGDTLYGLTRGVEHPSVPQDGKVVRCASFYSMWRCRTIPCPAGSDRPACETVLLHHEGLRIPERLARFAVRHGMQGFFKGMVPLVKEFVAKRRIRLGPTDTDPEAYGVAPLARCPSNELEWGGSEASFATDSAYESSELQAAGEQQGQGAGMRKSPSLRRLGYMVLASGVALAIARTGSSTNLAAAATAAAATTSAPAAAAHAAPSGGKQHHRKRHGHSHHGHHGHGKGHGHGSHSAHSSGTLPKTQRAGGRVHEVATLAALLED